MIALTLTSYEMTHFTESSDTLSTFNSDHHNDHHHHHNHHHNHQHDIYQSHQDPENIWSLTNRIQHDGMGRGRDPEYQGCCCKGAHYVLGVFGVVLVLLVCVLITWETVRSVMAYNEASASDSNGEVASSMTENSGG